MAGFYDHLEFPGQAGRVVICTAFSLKMETAIHRCSSKYVFLKISQYSQENICAEVSF